MTAEFSKTFRDSLGRDWTVDISVGAARRMKSIAGFTLDELAPPADKDGKRPDGSAAIQSFLSDPFKVFDVFYALVKPIADARGLTKEQVEDGIVTYTDAAGATHDVASLMGIALFRSIHDFFPWDPPRQAILRKLAEVGAEAMGLAAARIDKEMGKIDVLKELSKSLDALPGINADDLAAALHGTSSKHATDTPVISGSTQTP